MLSFFRQLKILFGQKALSEVATYRKSCEQLIFKYEQLLQHISDYMRNNRYVLHSTDEIEKTEEETHSLQINSFSFFAIKDELSNITYECDQLLSRGNDNLVAVPQRSEIIKILVAQLEDLRKYSDQIEEALSDFEDKLLEMEEALASRSLCN